MSRRRFYGAGAAAFVVGLWAISNYPDVALAILTPSVVAMIVLAAISTLYLWRVFTWQHPPRSRFYRMLLESFVFLLFVGGWVAYLTVGRILERMHADGQVDFTIPVPPPAISAPISALVVIVVFAAPVRFAWEVYRIRRTVPREQKNDDITTDRDDVTPPLPGHGHVQHAGAAKAMNGDPVQIDQARSVAAPVDEYDDDRIPR